MNGDFPPFPFGVGEYDPEVYPYHCFGDHDAFANPNPFLGDPGIHLNHQQISSDSTIYLAKNDYCPDSTYYSTVGTSTASSPSLSEPLVPTSNALNEEDEDEFVGYAHPQSLLC
jgi:hypothetical protein